jgi:hypothetical protein
MPEEACKGMVITALLTVVSITADAPVFVVAGPAPRRLRGLAAATASTGEGLDTTATAGVANAAVTINSARAETLPAIVRPSIFNMILRQSTSRHSSGLGLQLTLGEVSYRALGSASGYEKNRTPMCDACFAGFPALSGLDRRQITRAMRDFGIEASPDQLTGKTSSVLLAVATRRPSASVTVASTNAARRPGFVTTPTAVSVPLVARTGLR